MINWAITILFIITIFCDIQTQNVTRSIDSITSIYDSRLSQIQPLKLLREKYINTEQIDSIGLVSYQIAYRLYWTRSLVEVKKYAQEAISILSKTGHSGHRIHTSYYYLLRSLNDQNLYSNTVEYQGDIISLPTNTALRNIVKTLSIVEVSKGYLAKGDAESSFGLLNLFYTNPSFDELPVSSKKFLMIELHKAAKARGGQNNLSEASALLDKIEELYRTDDTIDLTIKDRADIILSRQVLALEQDELSNVVIYADQMNKIIAQKELQKKHHIYHILINSNAYVALHRMGKHKEAYRRLNAEKKIVDNTPELSKVARSHFYQNLAVANKSLDNFEKADALFTKALTCLGYDTDRKNAIELNKLENKSDILELLFDYISFLKEKSSSLQNVRPKDTDKIKLAIIDLDILIEEQYDDLLFENSVLSLKNDANKYYKLATDIAYTANDQSLFFRYAERNRGQLLLDNWHKLNRSQSKEYQKLDSLFYSLRAEEIKLEFYNNLNLSDSISRLLVLNKNDQIRIKRKLKSQRQHDFSNVLSLDRCQTGTNSDILYYHYGQDSLYGFYITRSSQKLITICSSKYIDSLVTIYTSSLATKNHSSKASHNLYRLLISPFDLSNQSLNIIPDGMLNFLPFETLISDTTDNTFLINDHNIKYSISLTLDDQWSKTASTKVKDFSVVSPDYNKDQFNDWMASNTRGSSNFEFKYLKYAKEEALNLKKKMSASLIDGIALTKESFYRSLSSADIFHFTGHAVLDPDQYQFSFLALGDKGDKLENIVTMSELNEAKTDAKLVFLNACNTGTGKLLKGEGAFDLSRAFFRAGAKSIVNALWEIDDKSSMFITLAFYKYLKKGQTKSAALRHAKLEYLHSEDIPEYKKHPYYWAGLVLVGNDAPLCFGHWYDGWWKYFMGMCGVGAGWLVWRRMV